MSNPLARRICVSSNVGAPCPDCHRAARAYGLQGALGYVEACPTHVEFHLRCATSDCPGCGSAGPHDDNGSTMLTELSFSCAGCGLCFDALP